jgi:hypothetical protein
MPAIQLGLFWYIFGNNCVCAGARKSLQNFLLKCFTCQPETRSLVIQHFGDELDTLKLACYALQTRFGSIPERAWLQVQGSGRFFNESERQRMEFHVSCRQESHRQIRTADKRGLATRCWCGFSSSNYSFPIILIEGWFETTIDIALLCFQLHIESEPPARPPVPVGKPIPYQIT